MTVHGADSRHRDLEAGEVDLAQGALVDDRVDDEPVGLVVVDREVLDAGADALGPGRRAPWRRRACPASSGSSERYSKQRPPAGWRLMLSPGPSTTADLLGPRSRAEGGADPSSEVDVPGRAEGRRGREAGGRNRAVEAEVVAAPACWRSPCGPSVSITDGMPCSSRALVRQKSAPDTTRSFSSRESRVTSARAASAGDADDGDGVGVSVLAMGVLSGSPRRRGGGARVRRRNLGPRRDRHRDITPTQGLRHPLRRA